MTFQQLELFCLLAEQKKQSVVASILFISQPAISNSMHALEKECGHSLFIRKNHHLELSEFGEHFYLKAKQIVLEKAHLTQFCLDFSDNQMRIGLPPSFADVQGFRFYSYLMQFFPSFSFTFQVDATQELIKKLSTDQVDVILSDYQDRRFSEEMVYADELGVFCTKDYPIEDIISLAELSAQPLLLRNKGCGNRSVIDTIFNKNNISPKIIIESSSTYSLIQFLKTGNGLGIISKNMMKECYENSFFKEILLKDESLQRNFYLSWKKGMEKDDSFIKFKDCVKKFFTTRV